MQRKLSRIQSVRRRLLVTVVVNIFVVFSVLSSRRARVHWVGGPRWQPRLERAMVALLFLFAMTVLPGRQFATWAAIWGGITAVLVTIYSLSILIPRKQNKSID